MARMHTRRKGRAGASRPIRDRSPSWVPMSPDKVTEKIMAYAREGLPPSQIGLRLRDIDAVPNVKELTGKSIVKILEENEMKPALPENLMMLMKKAVNLHKHIQENKKDVHNKRSLNLIEAKIRRLVRYYTKTGELPVGWKYSLSSAKLLVE